jgi:CheY-like chemotaxis protein
MRVVCRCVGRVNTIPTAHSLPTTPQGDGHASTDAGAAFLSGASDYISTTAKIFQEMARLTDELERQQCVRDVYRRVQGVAATATSAGLKVTAQFASVLSTLLKKLSDNPRTVTFSTTNTVNKALDFLRRWCVPGMEEQATGFPPVRLLVVEDEPLARRAVMGTLEQLFEKPETAGHGAAALVLVAQQTYDVIFTDVQMPVMDGFDLCRLIRDSEANRTTPIVFISACTNAESYAEGQRSGGSDFIAKPFLPSEMAVKALTFAWEGRLEKLVP